VPVYLVPPRSRSPGSMLATAGACRTCSS